jgi:long-chain acyl-CoA synthetase
LTEEIPGSLDMLCARALARDASLPAIEFQGRWIHWGEMRRVADRLATLVAASGAGPRASVALVARNRPSAIAALLGLIAMRRTVRMVYSYQSAAALARNVGQLAPAVIVAAREDYSEELLATLRSGATAAIALEEMSAAAIVGLERSRGDAEPDCPSSEPQIEILTSGTTGPPKRFALSFDLIAKHYVGAGSLFSGADSPVNAPPTLLFMPLGNISGVYTTLPAVLKNQRVSLLEKFTVAAWHEHLLRYRPEASGLPPAGVQMVLDADIPAADLACIRRFGTGAAPLDPTVQRAFEERYGIPILLSYGATEFGGPVAAMTSELHAEWGARKFGSVGRALPGARLRVVDPETGAELTAGHEGLLEVISPRIGPGWIRTSDVGLMDEDGFLFLHGRADGAIMRGGFKLLPETIERALLTHPAISAAAVLGIAEKRLGEVPAAVIQLKPGCVQPSLSELESHLRGRLYATHIPAAWRFVEELPRTPSLKVDRRALLPLFQPDAESGSNLEKMA